MKESTCYLKDCFKTSIRAYQTELGGLKRKIKNRNTLRDNTNVKGIAYDEEEVVECHYR